MISNFSLQVLELGRAPYREVWELQKKLHAALLEGSGADSLILCEHEPVITLGRSAEPQNVLAQGELLRAKGIEVIAIERGGDVTYHGPGQLVAYPVLNLGRKKRDVGWYMRGLEEVILSTISAFGVSGIRRDGKTGVWIAPQTPGAPFRKIASLGVRISRWCTYHGLALNIDDCSAGFSLVNPCGFTDIVVTSLAQEAKQAPGSALVAVELLGHFCRVFDYSSRHEYAERRSA